MPDRGDMAAFTLVELMIVILGMLLAIAIPAYQDFSVRARVADGLQLATATKLAVTESRATKAGWPDNNAEAADYTPPTTSHVESADVGDGGVLTVPYSHHPAMAGAAGATLLLTPSYAGGAAAWDCNGTRGVGSSGDMPGKYLPSSCR